MFAALGNKEAQESIRDQRPEEYHCPWLKRDSNACEALPDGIDGIEPGQVCPHNVYHHKPAVFNNRDAALDTIERLFRLIGSAELGLVTESELDPMTVTELLTAKSELNRQDNIRQKNEHARARLEAEGNRNSRDNYLGITQNG